MSRFRDELRVIPRIAWIIAVLVYAGLAGLFVLLFVRSPDSQGWPSWGTALLTALIPLPVTVLVLLIGYVNGDARRRGMRHVMWTLLAIFVPNAIGIILYFIFREPVLVPCPNCGAPVRASFAFCPRCGAQLAPACPQCRRPAEEGWSHCAFCGARVG